MSVLIGFWNEFLPHEKTLMSGIIAEMVFLALACCLNFNQIITISVCFGSLAFILHRVHKIWLANQQKPLPQDQYLQETK
jgi:hypothetical protein